MICGFCENDVLMLFPNGGCAACKDLEPVKSRTQYHREYQKQRLADSEKRARYNRYQRDYKRQRQFKEAAA